MRGAWENPEPARDLLALSRLAASTRLLAFVGAIVIAGFGYHDHFYPGLYAWWRWVVEIAAAAAILVWAVPVVPSGAESFARRILRWSCFAVAAAASWAAIDWIPQRGLELESAIAVFVAILASIFARWVPFAPSAVAGFVARGHRVRGWRPLAFVVAVSGICISVAAVILNDDDHLLGFFLWLAGISGFAAGVRLGSGRAIPLDCSALHAAESGPPLRRATEAMLFAIILALGSGFRLFALGDVPTWIDADEGRLATWGLGIWKDGFPDAFAFGWNSFPHLAYMLHVSGVQLLGFANVHLRLVSALIGILSLIPVFFWARRWWGGAVGLIAMALLAVNQEHVYWSRVGFNNIDAVLVAGLVLASYARALRTARAIDWVWVGLAVGIGYHTYHAAKLYPVLLAFGFLPLVIGARGTLAAHWRGLVAAGTAFLLVLGPQITSLQRQWTTFRIDTTNRNNVHRAVEAYLAGDTGAVRDHVYRQVVDCLYAFLSVPYKQPLLDAATAILFLVGILWLFWRWRDPRHVLVFVWIAGILVAGGMMTDFPPSKQRMVGFLPALCVVAAVVAGRARGLLHRVAGCRGDALAFVVIVGWLFMAAYNNWWTHFVYQADFMRGDVMTNVCRRLKSMERPFTVYTVGATSSTNPRMLERDCTLGPDEARTIVNPPADHAIVPLPPEHRGAALISIPGEFRSMVPLVRAMYPEAKFEIVRGASGNEDIYFFTLLRSQIERTRGLVLQFEDANGTLRLGEMPPAYPPPGYVYLLGLPAEAAPGTTAHWYGYIRVPASGTYAFRAVGGEVRVSGRTSPAEGLELVEGWNPIEVEMRASGERETRPVEWKKPGTVEWEIVPRELFFARTTVPRLLGRYFASDLPDSGAKPIARQPVHTRLETALFFDWHFYDDEPIPDWFAARPSTMEWTGTVDPGRLGIDAMRVVATSPTEVFLGSERIAAIAGTPQERSVEIALDGSKGELPLLVRTCRAADADPVEWALQVTWSSARDTWTALADYSPEVSEDERVDGLARSALSGPGDREDGLRGN